MKKTVIFSALFIIILSTFNLCFGATSKSLRAKFEVTDISGTEFKNITIIPYDNTRDEENNEEDYTYKIYLPSGYMVEGKSATYAADINGKYPFTVYDGSFKKTFVYTVDDIEDSSSTNNKEKDDIPVFQYKLEYDFEKKQVFLNVLLDKQRTVKISGSTYISNEVNHYIKKLDNNVPFDLTLNIDNKEFNYKLIKSGEFYLLISISPVNYNDYSTIVEYFGYNFASNDSFEAYPSKDIYDDNGNYEVLIKSKNTQHVFLINITGIDYRRPSLSLGFQDDNTFHLEIEDDFNLSHLITFDGKYIPLNNNSETIEYNHKTEIVYNGDYIFTAVDEKGNRTTKVREIKTERRLTRPHRINLEVHDFKDTEDLFKHIGLDFDDKKDTRQYFYNILPSYMNGKSPNSFNPDSPISRAEVVTIFCRLNNLPYDTGARLKSKFTDIENHWARDYISMGSSKRYVSGYKDKTFKPDNNVTRAEFCQMLTKISAYKSLLNAIPASIHVEYSDIFGHWAESEIIKIAGRNLVEGNLNNFHPDKPITRGEVVHAINMLYGYNPTFSELQFEKSLYNKYYYFNDIQNHKFYNDIIISVVGMYREKID